MYTDKFEKAMHDPTSVFRSPEEVADDAALTLEQKIQILQQWEYDARDIQVAEEENMTGKIPSMLDRVIKALLKINAKLDTEHSPTTKQGGDRILPGNAAPTKAAASERFSKEEDQ